MAKKQEKEEKITFKSVLNKLMEKSLQSLISVAAEEAEHLAKWIRDLSGIGKKIRHLMTTIILFSAGLGVLGIGVALYINELYPNLSNGTSHILIGLIIILIAALLTKYNQ
ncbi:hypothetical protein CMO94_02645 [Candidatus Woesearchaeota archaeon]|jgi:hypothetical protein|nr:hypothetical protein [Candidatus Woesearchaeota archaeon]MDP7244212.1 hypothetical protein [Flavobacteriales bacterium]|tara:strand:+ start:81 stop:413 length:333 start_codon:yes stop_codon:yes gene_type:complete